MIDLKKNKFITVYALHGFLGQPSDWVGLINLYEASFFLNAESLYPNNLEQASFSGWATCFNSAICARVPYEADHLRVLMGYSLGGRLALHALLDRPELWDAAVIISAHTGLPSVEKKQQKKEQDEAWARRFEIEDWNSLMNGWNRQPVFQKDTFCFEREEKDYDRSLLALALRDWSLGKQEDLSEPISQLNLPILWIAGSEDIPYADLCNRLAFKHSLSRKWLAPLAGHRVPWQQQQNFLLQVNRFLNTLEN